jgi:acetyl-CoA carboxylase biotin carboxylase subunit
VFSKILVANRGEIAVRIIRACKEMGILTVAVYSEADSSALHVSLADESFCVGPAPVLNSYLNIPEIMSVALLTQCEAIHPGYGLLSENARFARICRDNGIVFIGPPADVIERMGDKNAARQLMKQAEVPVVPGSDGIVQTYEEALGVANHIGYPLLVKASAGGGGKGIRLVKSEAELKKSFTAAAVEAKAAFGDDGLYMEKYINPVKHIEVQIICDAAGNVVCLGERECSVQRRNQKIIEESPSPAINQQLRDRMMEAAAKAAKASGYINVGTVEFLLDMEGNFYFMEMNTRLQVEHPVTEMVTGLDLVQWQMRIASGAELDLTQKDVSLNGHAIECRINAEDTLRGFLPSCGNIELLHIPGGPNVRFDTALYQGYYIPPFYDSMIGKLIVHARNRAEAIRKIQAALCELVVEGIEHNRELLIDIIADASFRSGEYTTDFLAKKSFGG